MENYNTVFGKKIISLLNESDNKNLDRWFSNSKVIDRQGNPLIVYHGTGGNIKTFDVSKFNAMESSGDYVGEGFFFAREISTAKKYGSSVGAYYLKIKKPIMINNKQDVSNFHDFIADNFSYKELENKLGLDEIEINKMIKLVGKSYIYFILKKKNPSLIREKLQKLGYDGLIDNLYGQYAVFEPSQVKSATDNKGTYSSSTNNIFE